MCFINICYRKERRHFYWWLFNTVQVCCFFVPSLKHVCGCRDPQDRMVSAPLTGALKHHLMFWTSSNSSNQMCFPSSTSIQVRSLSDSTIDVIAFMFLRSTSFQQYSLLFITENAQSFSFETQRGEFMSLLQKLITTYITKFLWGNMFPGRND